MRPYRHLSVGFHWLIIGIAGGIAGTGCAVDKHALVKPGKTTVSQLKATLGAPSRTDASSLRPSAMIYEYPNHQTYQVEHGTVVAKNRPPEPQEVTLQYWRHTWQAKGVATRYEEVPGSMDPHGHAQYQLTAPSLKTSVIYDPNRDRVVRVVEYGAPN
jgi:hypothetical protein